MADTDILDECTIEIRATFALLKAHTLDALHRLENPPIRPADHVDISGTFDNAQNDLLADVVNWLRDNRDSAHQIAADRATYEREIAREDKDRK